MYQIALKSWSDRIVCFTYSITKICTESLQGNLLNPFHEAYKFFMTNVKGGFNKTIYTINSFGSSKCGPMISLQLKDYLPFTPTDQFSLIPNNERKVQLWVSKGVYYTFNKIVFMRTSSKNELFSKLRA